jgi:hypothetical protein
MANAFALNAASESLTSAAFRVLLINARNADHCWCERSSQRTKPVTISVACGRGGIGKTAVGRMRATVYPVKLKRSGKSRELFFQDRENAKSNKGFESRTREAK